MTSGTKKNASKTSELALQEKRSRVISRSLSKLEPLKNEDNEEKQKEQEEEEHLPDEHADGEFRRPQTSSLKLHDPPESKLMASLLKIEEEDEEDEEKEEEEKEEEDEEEEEEEEEGNINEYDEEEQIEGELEGSLQIEKDEKESDHKEEKEGLEVKEDSEKDLEHEEVIEDVNEEDEEVYKLHVDDEKDDTLLESRISELAASRQVSGLPHDEISDILEAIERENTVLGTGRHLTGEEWSDATWLQIAARQIAARRSTKKADIALRKEKYPELYRDDVSVYPSYTDVRLPYVSASRRRYQRAMRIMQTQVQRDIEEMALLQPRALDGVRTIRSFCQSVGPDGGKYSLNIKDKERLERLLLGNIY